MRSNLCVAQMLKYLPVGSQIVKLLIHCYIEAGMSPLHQFFNYLISAKSLINLSSMTYVIDCDYLVLVIDFINNAPVTNTQFE
ncbi:hypothetical protein BMS3Bbin09_00109 [bacterium BMS3Bbin09]|nr:hypothetical protein BMS3Bbin09_00109 [bacterium BMS3Bbin09]